MHAAVLVISLFADLAAAPSPHDDIVMIAEPRDAALRKQLRERPWKDVAYQLTWTTDRVRVATAYPRVSLWVNANLPLSFYLDGKLVETTGSDGGAVRLLAGVVKVLDEHGHVGWVYVTPYPALVQKSGAPFAFELPKGRYRIHSWQPPAEERSRVGR